MDKKQLTTAAGRPVGDNQNALTVGPRGPIVFEDFLLFEKMAHFNRERVPERVVHAKGSGAYGSFVCTNPEMPMYHRDGAMRFDGNFGSAPNYEPNSFQGPVEHARYRERPRTITGAVDRHDHRADSDYYTQPGNLFRLMTPDARARLIGNIVASMQSVPRHIQARQTGHFYRADPEYGCGVAEGLRLRMEEVLHGEPVTTAR